MFPAKQGRIVLDETMRADFALLLLDALPGQQRAFTSDTVGLLRSIRRTTSTGG